MSEAARPLSPQGPALIWCPFPDVASAEQVITILLEERLIVCANLVPGMISRYSWQGQLLRGDETGVLFKTDVALLAMAGDRLAALHPYSDPAVMGWRCDYAALATQTWLGDLFA